jgi:aminotransferase
MTRISDAHNAINLSQGFPDFPPPSEMTSALSRIALTGPHQYAITFGAENFRHALADKHAMFSGMNINPDTEIVVTCGGTEAMMVAMMTVCNSGDKVIVFSPFYENYGADAILSGAQPIFEPLAPPDFRYNPDSLENAFKQGVKAIIVCNPSNPCGKVFTREELTHIGALVMKYDTFIITDEVYEHIVFSPHTHIYAAALPGLRERTLCCSSLSKTFSITGWRLGYLIGPGEVIENAKKVHDFLTVGAASPLQEAAVTGLRLPASYYDDLKELYTRKRERFLQGLADIGMNCTPPQGTYFVMVDISRFLAQDRFRGWSDLQFCEWMTAAVGVAAVPGSSFFREPVNHFIRFHFARAEATLDEAIARLGRLDKKLKSM